MFPGVSGENGYMIVAPWGIHNARTVTGPARAAQLYEDVQQAGYKFGGAKRENNLNYLYKLLRTNKVFKRVGDGQYTLA